MSEYLDRKQVIDLYEKYQPSLAIHVYEFGEKLRSLPVTQDSNGEWKLTLDGCECSVCKDKTLVLPMNFCPNCGSDNRPREGDELSNMKYFVCCPMCDKDKCVRGTEECDAEKWEKEKEGERN